MTIGMAGSSAMLPPAGLAAQQAAAPAAAPAGSLDLQAILGLRHKTLSVWTVDSTQQAGLPAGAPPTAAAGSPAGSAAATLQQQAAAAQQAQLAATQQAQQALRTQQAAAAAQQQTVSRPVAAAPAQQAQPVALQPRKYTPYTAHIAQYRGAWLPDGPTMAPNCGPASVTIALRMIGLDIPGYNGQRSNDVLTKARIMATGRNDTSIGTTDTELERVLTASGARWTESTDLNQMLGWVNSGTPVILAGNPSQAWNRRIPSDQVYHYDGGHWVTVSGYNQQTGNWIVNDPLSQVGPIEVSHSELATYMSRNGGLGIAVYR